MCHRPPALSSVQPSFNCQLTPVSRVTSDQQIILFIFNIERFTVLTVEIFSRNWVKNIFVFSLAGWQLGNFYCQILWLRWHLFTQADFIATLKIYLNFLLFSASLHHFFSELLEMHIIGTTVWWWYVGGGGWWKGPECGYKLLLGTICTIYEP